ncbi:aldose 1-epimerase family protein [Flavobacterium sp.]|uniref:aldose 1-epimerase family protein n=1 Tax=Flavobacterium sp. TaxID=239 RepID=UPI00261F0ADC|nr:aldose 1-epimerase family protein [Flavobacterium sp.]
MDIQITNGKLTASFKNKGAELISLQDDNGREYMWGGNPDFWGKHSPVLFPIVGTLKNNSYNYNGKAYTLNRHGFARDMVFTIKQKDDISVSFSLVYSNETLKFYPFSFELIISYRLDENNLIVHYTIKNHHTEAPMLFSIGAHPAFDLPGNFLDYSLHFDSDETLTATPLKDDLLTNGMSRITLQEKMLPLRYSLFENDALVFKQLLSRSVSIAFKGKPFLKVTYDDFPSLGIWTKPGAPFICIEPWQGYADNTDSNGRLEDKEGIITLEAGTEASKSFSVEILN